MALAVVGLSSERAAKETQLRDDMIRVAHRAGARYWRPYLEYAQQRGELRRDVDLGQAVRWLTFMVFHFLTVPETVPPHDELPVYLKTFVVNALIDD